ncbi:ABC transporter substrate-binding protein [Mongoliitalea lutea]|uniref:ABC transporter substrate-binding protein n=1 Tax=Mongoliitalea lutea TaxID=849756 RepID=A0A8J3D0E2_9BACT|nr:ABC transporter substrate-binding protein [Mongoliitalea lutea]GHB51588.1 ABC transporter substrate-binding protein [Mongoliitalea lutea]
MKQVRITGVPEHFNILWKKLVQAQPFKDQGYELVWIDEPKGSGAMNAALREGKTDIALLLTESFVRDKIDGNPGLITDWYVSSPLTWGIHVSVQSSQNAIDSYKNPPVAISRFGSGSHLMAFLLAKREHWDLEKVTFEVINDLKGAIANAENGGEHIFLWEKFTTNPYVEKGIFKRIGEIPTPWPCFVTVAHENFLASDAAIMKQIQQAIKASAFELQKNNETITEISEHYNLIKKDVERWISQTSWAVTNEIKSSELEAVMQILKELGLISHQIPVSLLVSTKLSKLLP